MSKTLVSRVREMLENFDCFTAEGGGVKLYGYQLEPARAIIESVRLNLGLTFVLVMPRQAGKDELLTHLLAYLMRNLSHKERGMVEVNPTYKPQTVQAVMRLENRMDFELPVHGAVEEMEGIYPPHRLLPDDVPFGRQCGQRGGRERRPAADHQRGPGCEPGDL